MTVALVMGSVLIMMGKMLGPSRPDAEKNSPYECGFEAFEDSRMKFDVRYYLVAILFIIFDLEIAFLFPWAIGGQVKEWGSILEMVQPKFKILFAGFTIEHFLQCRFVFAKW